MPLVLAFIISFTPESLITKDGYSFFPKSLSLEAYGFLLKDGASIIKGYTVTFLVTIVGTVSSVLINAGYAYPISRKNLPGRRFLTMFLFFTMLFNGGLVASYMINMQIYNFKDNLLALLTPFLISPFNVLLLRTYFMNSIPDSLIETSKIDGASEFRIFLQIMLPLSKPVLATIALFNTLAYWNDWFSSLLYITDKNLFSLQYIMYKALMNVDYLKRSIMMGAGGDMAMKLTEIPAQSIRFAMVIIGIGPIILAYPFFQRYFTAGLTVGAVKE
jgi:putative aldouronate transport system permease protein